MADNNNDQAFLIESTDTVNTFNRLELGQPASFGIKISFSDSMTEEQLDAIQDRLGLRISLFQNSGSRDVIPSCEFVPPVSRNGVDFFFQLTLPKKKAAADELGCSDSDYSDFILVEYLLLNEKPLTAAAKRKLEPTAWVDNGRESFEYQVMQNALYQDGTQKLENAVQNNQQTLVEAIKAIGDNIGDGQVDVNLLSSTNPKSAVLVCFKDILDATRALSFDNYQSQIDMLFCGREEGGKLLGKVKKMNSIRSLPFKDTDSYRVLKIATEAFLMANVGCNLANIGSDDALANHFAERSVNFSANDKRSLNTLWKDYINPNNPVPGDPQNVQVLPYLYIIRRKFKELGIKKNWFDQVIEDNINKGFGIDRMMMDDAEDTCIGVIQQRLQCPLYLELIWSYWQEEGMLVQTMHAISQRFQNIKAPGARDPLAEMEITHLLPLNNIFWGYIQDEQHRLSLQRRAYEYDHHYGFNLQGKAAPKLRSADSRSRFIEAFHSLLHLAAQYYKDVTNKLVDPDPYPILNALRDVHFIISEGMHNQYGALPSTARAEMLMQQWILARPEFRQFLPGRAAVPYTETWMERVASMNKLKGWTDVSPMHFNYLATYGEQLLLSIRYVDWSEEDRLPSDASLWMRYWRLQIQGYIHSYKAVTGIDLGASSQLITNKIDTRPPSYHLARRLKQQQNKSKAKSNGVPARTTKRKSTSKKETF